MKTIVAGGRDYEFTPADIEFMDSLKEKVSEIVSGACGAKSAADPATGADGFGETWAANNDVKVERFYPNWKEHGRGAGPRRNRTMAEYADAVVLFPGGRGTESMYREAKSKKLVIYDRRKEVVQLGLL
ncbi:SLOG family protein [Persicirhabdus sediminis]|uniref:DUF2493 domain-containing protein n=1 Tax=Persicirhabdus sediminis TaxID=454144 RepID=A0A8J7MC04_9BACT|nr:SLOG family protein [Persicirhabdus sediminis]MBK1789622.1 DUF2493 domain-containing protein [Persicirhabdus sediminis]